MGGPENCADVKKIHYLLETLLFGKRRKGDQDTRKLET